MAIETIPPQVRFKDIEKSLIALGAKRRQDLDSVLELVMPLEVDISLRDSFLGVSANACAWLLLPIYEDRPSMPARFSSFHSGLYTKQEIEKVADDVEFAQIYPDVMDISTGRLDKTERRAIALLQKRRKKGTSFSFDETGRFIGGGKRFFELRNTIGSLATIHNYQYPANNKNTRRLA